MAARRIGFLNFKGGVGKTTLAVNIAAFLARDLGQKVLLVDCDPQRNASRAVVAPEWMEEKNSQEPDRSVMGILTGAIPSVHSAVFGCVPPDDLVYQSTVLRVILGHFNIVNLEWELTSEKERKAMILRFYQAMEALSPAYDYIIMDCPPSLGLPTRAAMLACTDVYIPCEPAEFSNMGIAKLIGTMSNFLEESKREFFDPQVSPMKQPKVRGVILNQVVGRANYDEEKRQIRQKLQAQRSAYPQLIAEDAEVLASEVRHSVLADKNVKLNVPMAFAKKRPAVAEDLSNLTRSIHHTLKGSE